MDHEITSDLLTSKGEVTNDIATFGSSWAVGNYSCPNENLAYTLEDPIEHVANNCATLFIAKSSHFSPCYGRVSVQKIKVFT